MIPVTVIGIIVLLLLVVPGLHYDLLRETYRPDRGESTFVEISRVLISGVFLSGAALAILGFARMIGPEIILDPRRLLIDHTYFASHLTLVMWSTAWFLALSLTLAAYFANIWPADPVIHSNTGSSWILAFARIPQSAAAKQGLPFPYIQVEVRLKDGRSYSGLLEGYSKNLELADRELILEGPLTTVAEGGQPISLSDQDWHRLILPAAEIASILVKYEAKSEQAIESQHGLLAVETPRRRKMVSSLKAFITWCYVRRGDLTWLGKLLIVEIVALFLCVLIIRLSQ